MLQVLPRHIHTHNKQLLMIRNFPCNWAFLCHVWHEFFYLQSASSFSGSVERMSPCVHLGQMMVLALVPNSSSLLHRWHVHQKNFASCRCCRLFSVPCRVHTWLLIFIRKWKMDLTNLQGVCITQAYDVAFLQCFSRSNDEFMCDGVVSMICVWHAVVAH